MKKARRGSNIFFGSSDPLKESRLEHQASFDMIHPNKKIPHTPKKKTTSIGQSLTFKVKVNNHISTDRKYKDFLELR